MPSYRGESRTGEKGFAREPARTLFRDAWLQPFRRRRMPMIFRQMLERESSTYSYLLASQGREALLIDPVKEELPKYLRLIEELDLRLVFAVDTHVHADHVTALGDL